MSKKYRLKKLYESPAGRVHPGISYTAKEWQSRWFPKLTDEDFGIKDDWFEEVTDIERIEVTKFMSSGFSDHGNWYQFHIASSPGKPWPEISEAQFPAIKEAIEKVLNPETDLQKEKDDIPVGELQPKEKDTLSRNWEIVSFSRSGENSPTWVKGTIAKHNNGKLFNNVVTGGGGWSEEELLGDVESSLGATVKSGRIKIHSVRRLSDNTVFGIGDTVAYRLHGVVCKEWIIDSFYIRDDGKMLAINKDSIMCEFVDDDLVKIPLLKPQPLFVTEDINKLMAIADILSRCWYYNKMKIETPNERVIYYLLKELNLYPTTESDILKRDRYDNYFEKYRNWPDEKILNH